MAILDRKVQIFALMNASQLLGSSFTQFFPTSVKLDTYEWLASKSLVLDWHRHSVLIQPLACFLPRECWDKDLDQCLIFAKTRPPWILASIVCCINAWHAGLLNPYPNQFQYSNGILDRTGERFYHIVGWWWCAILGFIIAMSTFSIAGRYVSLFLMACEYSGKFLTFVKRGEYFSFWYVKRLQWLWSGYPILFRGLLRMFCFAVIIGVTNVFL